jgi:Uma2 family endonuclease
MQALKLAPISFEDYLAIEHQEDKRYEFHDGYTYAMAGGSYNHSIIGANFIRSIGTKLIAKGSSCFPTSSDLKLHIEHGNRYLYPDAMVLCKDQVKKSSKYKEAVTNPVVIVEVLSESTADYDRKDKLFFYQQIPSLKEYVLVEQDKAQVSIFSRGEGDFWKFDLISGLEKTVDLSSLGIALDLKELYLNIEWESGNSKR